MKGEISNSTHQTFSGDPLRISEERIRGFLNQKGKESMHELRKRMQSLMMEQDR